MKVILANKAGFCMGVRMAMDMVAGLPFDHDNIIYTDGPLIHNPQVVDILKKRNIIPLENDHNLGNNQVIVRTHGVAPGRLEELKKKSVKIRNATCPRVVRIQKIIAREVNEGYGIIIFGDSNHSEVRGLIGYAEDKGYALNSPKEIVHLPEMEKVAVVSQSTKNRADYNEFVNKINASYKNVKVFDTLCDTTARRQDEAIEISKQVDAMVVVGGKQSANTRTLAQAAGLIGKSVFHIETEKELNEDDFKAFSIVGLTAGASTPNWMINRVHEKLRLMKAANESTLFFTLGKLVRFLVYSNLLVSIAAFFLSFAAAALIGVESGLKQYFVAPLYVYSMSILNIFVDFNSIELNQPSKINFLLKYKTVLISSGIASAAATITLAATLRIEALIVISIAVILGLIYSLPILPDKWSNFFHLHRFSDISGSKGMLVAGAWAATTVLIHPLSLQGLRIFDPSTLIVFLWVFGLVFNQMIVAEMRYLQGDAILGQSTLPVLLGKKQVNRLLSIIDLFLITILLLGVILGICTKLAYFMVIPLAYSIGLQRFHRKTRIKNSLTFEAALLMEFFFFGLVALVWKLL